MKDSSHSCAGSWLAGLWLKRGYNGKYEKWSCFLSFVLKVAIPDTAISFTHTAELQGSHTTHICSCGSAEAIDVQHRTPGTWWHNIFLLTLQNSELKSPLWIVKMNFCCKLTFEFKTNKMFIQRHPAPFSVYQKVHSISI